MTVTHKPVLVNEVLEYLNPKPNENFVDGTVGEAGHALQILKKNGPGGKVLGIDWDKQQIENSKLQVADFQERIILVHDSYANIKNIVAETHFEHINGILLDVGYSSWQIEKSEKGFSFQKDERLDMRYNLQHDLTAEKIINEWPEEKLEQILQEYGEEKFSRKIAKEIVSQRKRKKIESTFDLKNIIERAVPGKFQHGKIHCGTRTFQALRIAVNGELDNLIKALPDAFSVLQPGGRLAVISFHSLEDRIVKNFFKEQEQTGLASVATKKPVTANFEELDQNPRARSAKLRVIIKI